MLTVLGVERERLDQWLTPTAPEVVPDDDPVWGADAEMAAFQQAAAGGL